MRRATRSGRHSVAPRSADRAFCAALAAAFAAALWATLALHASMDAMGGTPMAGGWTLSAAWGGSCGWRPGRAFGEFVGMWAAMTATMMLPVLAPELWRYRRRMGASGDARAGWRVVVAGAGYLGVWLVLGAMVFPVGAGLAAAAARLPALAAAMPTAAGAVMLAAGALQFSGWKRRRLACCRHMAAADDDGPRAGVGAAWLYGLRAGVRCAACCGNLMGAAVAAGMMDLRVMTIVTAAIDAERLAPGGACVARVVGGVALGAGAVMVVRAVAALA